MYNRLNANNLAPWLAKRLRENEIGKGYLQATGKMNAWDLPEFETARNDMFMERDLGLSDLTRRLSGSGVQGPAAGLLMERSGNQYSNSLLNLANKLRGSFIDRGLNIGSQAIDQGNQEFNMRLAARNAHEQRKQQPNDFMKTMAGINSVIDTISKGASLGFGAAGMMGKLPGMGGTSALAGGGQSAIMQQLMQQIMSMLSKGGPAPSGSTWG